MSDATTTDLYEVTMALSYLREGLTRPATFSLFVRDVPPDRGFLVAAGLESVLGHLTGFRVDAGDVEVFASVLDRPPDDMEPLLGLTFTGDVRAVPEGRVVLAGEPLMEITAPLPQAQLLESYVLNQVNHQTTVASKCARCVLAAAGHPVVDFSLRRTQGTEAAYQAARLGAVVGFAGTSNVAAAHAEGVPAVGTMAHSYIEVFGTEEEAFRAFARAHPGPVTFLVDTYDTENGVATAARVLKDLGLGPGCAIRLDSGDLGALAVRSRRILDAAGLHEVRIVASGGLDEFAVDRLVRSGASIDTYAVGTKIGVSADAPYLDSAYKLVEYDGRPEQHPVRGSFQHGACDGHFRVLGHGLFQHFVQDGGCLVRVGLGGHVDLGQELRRLLGAAPGPYGLELTSTGLGLAQGEPHSGGGLVRLAHTDDDPVAHALDVALLAANHDDRAVGTSRHREAHGAQQEFLDGSSSGRAGHQDGRAARLLHQRVHRVVRHGHGSRLRVRGELPGPLLARGDDVLGRHLLRRSLTGERWHRPLIALPHRRVDHAQGEPEARRLLHLNGTQAGEIQQELLTAPGHRVTVKLRAGHNTAGMYDTDALFWIQVNEDPTTRVTYNLGALSNLVDQPGKQNYWHEVTYQFIAEGHDVLQLHGDPEGGAYGAIITEIRAYQAAA